ncbi:MAG: hypothetical protein ABSG32_33515 [Terriglobia bacterium]|jgi:hypothetical protein
MKKQSKRAVPAFASEAEEAAWWYENRKSHDKEFTAAVESGEAQLLTREKLRERIEASKAKTPAHVISLRVPEADLAMARRQAERKGFLTRPTSNRYCTKRLPSAKSERRDERSAAGSGRGAVHIRELLSRGSHAAMPSRRG